VSKLRCFGHDSHFDFIQLRPFSTRVYESLTANIDNIMCRKYCDSTNPEELDALCTFELTPWSTMFSGSCGKFIILCLLISFVLFVMMTIYAGIYATSVSNHPSIVCVSSSSFFIWGIIVPIVLAGWLLSLFLALGLGSGEGKIFIIVFGIILVFFYGTMFILYSTLSPISDENGIIIRDGNNSDVMFQYLDDGENMKAYPIFLRSDGINDTYPNSTCGPKPFSDLCRVFGPLRGINASEAFRCTPNDAEGLELLLLYLGPFMGLARTAMNLGIAFPAFFLFGFTLLMRRRLYPPDSWIENRLCLPSRRSGLNKLTQSEYEAL
jgi:hypothetical protein